MRLALAKAGWNVIRTAASSDALVVAHYAQKGRDLFCYLHGGVFSVANIGAANEAQKLAEALAKEGHIAIYGIYFDSDRSTLRPDSETALQHMLELLRTDAKLAVEIQGHTDNTGTAPHNLPLSEARAASVKNWLLDHGIADSRLSSAHLQTPFTTPGGGVHARSIAGLPACGRTRPPWHEIHPWPRSGRLRVPLATSMAELPGRALLFSQLRIRASWVQDADPDQPLRASRRTEATFHELVTWSGPGRDTGSGGSHYLQSVPQEEHGTIPAL